FPGKEAELRAAGQLRAAVPRWSIEGACRRSELMKVYEGANIRNVAVMGHGHAGKTSLVSAMLYTAGASQRMGRVDDGSAATDYDEEGSVRKSSISAGLAYAEGSEQMRKECWNRSPTRLDGLSFLWNFRSEKRRT